MFGTQLAKYEKPFDFQTVTTLSVSTMGWEKVHLLNEAWQFFKKLYTEICGKLLKEKHVDWPHRLLSLFNPNMYKFDKTIKNYIP